MADLLSHPGGRWRRGLSEVKRLRTVAGFALAVVAVLVIAAVSYRAVAANASVSAGVVRTLTIIDRLDATSSKLKDAETGQRGFLLTGADGYLDPYRTAMQALPNLQASLWELTADNPLQQRRLLELREAIAQKTNELDLTIALARGGNLEAALARVRTGTGMRAMNRATALFEESRSEELDRLAAGRAASSEAAVFSSNVAWASSALLLVLIALAAWMHHAMLASAQRYRSTLDNMLEGCRIIGYDWRFKYINDAAALQSRQTKQELVGATIMEAHPQIEHTEIYAKGQICMRDRTPQYIETEIVYRDDSRGWFQMRVLPTAGGIALFSVDITDRKRAEQEILMLNADLERRVLGRTAELVSAREAAEAANRAKSAFLATMSHEIRTPMNGVIGMVEVLIHSDLQEHQADAVRTIRTSAFSLLGIIDDILDFSKIEAGRLELERAPVALPELIESVCETLMPIALDKDVELHLFVAPTVPALVWADATRLRQILINLGGNAIKFSAGRSERRGRVSIRATVDDKTPANLVLQFTDNGIGMAPQTFAQLFSPFTQAEASTTRRFGGTGLGLTICKRLVDLMSGAIKVASTLGRGSRFKVTLPLQVVEGRKTVPGHKLTDLECIIVGTDDTVDDLRIHLEHAGARVVVVSRLDQALQRAFGMTRPVVIHSRWRQSTALDGLYAALAEAPDVRHVLIRRTRRRAAPLVVKGVVTLEANCLRRIALIRAVAVAAGRRSPEVLHDDPDSSDIIDQADAPTVAEARAQNRLILIAEDDEVNQKVILRQIELLGYAAEIAANGAEALRLWSAGEYALLLTDLHMPDMDGYTLAEAIRLKEAAADAGERMPILALTANALQGEAARARAAGMDEYLTKPLQLHLLKAALGRWLPRDKPDTVPAEFDTQPPDIRSDLAIDLSVLKGIVGDDAQVVDEFLADFRISAERMAAELRAASNAEDTRQVGAVAHRLKSIARSVGAMALGDACAELENASTIGGRDGVSLGMAQFEAALLLLNAQPGPPSG